MSTENGKSLDYLELACLPPNDPARLQLQEQLRLGQVVRPTRHIWESEMALTDRLREALADVPVPLNLQQRLLAIAQSHDAVSAPKRGLSAFWKVAAMLLLVAGIFAIYFATRPALPAELAPAVASAISDQAVKHVDAVLAIASDNPDAVAAALAKQSLDFPVLMLKPTKGAVLVGGGICDFGNAKAAYTKWQNNGLSYTLFEFNGKNLGAPAQFIPTTHKPTELWRDDKHYQVVMFAGSQQDDGKCCWALVMETDNARNIFSQYGTSY